MVDLKYICIMLMIPPPSQVPEVGNKTLYIPLADNETEQLESCREFRDPSNHEAGTQECSGGYEFNFQGENEMTITAEVRIGRRERW